MPVETFNYLDSLNPSNPPTSDGLVGGDDHIRGIKASLKNTFPNFTASALTSTQAQIDAIVAFLVSGQLKGNGAVEVGSTHMFLVEPAGLGKAATGTGHRYLELDGSTWPNSAFPALAAHLGQGGTTFTLPDAKTLGRFPRSRTASVAAGTTQAGTVGAHTHPDVNITSGLESASHTHFYSGTSGGMNSNASHTHTFTGYDGGSVNAGGGFGGDVGGVKTTNATNIDHTHSYSGNTGSQSANHTHTSLVTTPSNIGTTETRPEALSFIFCIKT